MTVPISGIEDGSNRDIWRYRCVFVRIGESPELISLHSAAVKLCCPDSTEPFMPHLSLLYSDCAASDRARIRDEVAATELGKLQRLHLDEIQARHWQCAVDCSQVWDTTGPENSWKLLSRYPLAAKSTIE